MGIPVVDLDSLSGWGKASASSTVADLVEAFSGIGFAFVTSHGVGLEPPAFWSVVKLQECALSE